MHKQHARELLRTGKINMNRFCVVAILPSGRLATVKGDFVSHRDAWNHMLTRKGELHARFGIKLFVLVQRGSV